MESIMPVMQEWFWSITALVLAYKGIRLLVFLVKQFIESIIL